MKAILICEETLKKRIRKYIDKNQHKIRSIIVTEPVLYAQITKQYNSIPKYFCNFLNDKNFDQAEVLTWKLQAQIEQLNDFVKEKSFALKTVNGLYADFARIIVNIKNTIDECLTDNEIDSICLFGGNPQVPFFGFNLAEGEKPFRFLYKREWMINFIVFNLYKDSVKIEWNAKDSRIFLSVLRDVRLYALNFAKLYKQMKKRSYSAKLSIDNKANYALLVVRSKPVVDAIFPIYQVLEKSTFIKPLVLAYENYTNNGLVNEIEKFDMRFIDLRSYINNKDKLTIFRKTFSDCSAVYDKNIIVTIDEDKHLTNTIAYSSKQLVKELKVGWWDSELLLLALERFKKQFAANVKFLINAETHGSVAATEAIWAKSHRIKTIGIPFVNLALRPVTSWMDVYFLMNKKEVNYFTQNRPKERFLFSGPVCYDFLFNSAEHCVGKLQNIGVFTQPEPFSKDCIKIIDELIQIRNNSSADWNITVKLHPRDNPAFYKTRFRHYGFISIYHNEINSTALIKKIDLALGISSNTLHQAIIAGVPVISVNFNGAHKMSIDFLQYDTVYKASTYDDIDRFISNFINYDLRFAECRNLYFRQQMDGYKGNGSSIIAAYMEREVAK